MSVGSELSAAREAAGLSLQDIADSTRIRRTVVERIEADDFSLCGGDVYARGHVRNIAKLVGLAPEPLIAEFDRQHAPAAPTAAEVFEAESTMRPERRTPNWTAAMAAALVVVVGVGLFQLFKGGGSSSANQSPVTAASGPSLAASHSPSASSSTTPSPSASVSVPAPSASSSVVAQLPPSAGGVTLQVTISGSKSWLSVATGAAGTVAYEGILATGDTKTFTDPSKIKLTLGNAGAVHLIVNGKDLGTPGNPGQVVHLSFTPGDPTGAG